MFLTEQFRPAASFDQARYRSKLRSAEWHRGVVMRHPHRVTLSLLAVVSVAISQLSSAQTRKLPNIVILATGGTIAGAAASGTQSAYTSGAVGIDAMVAAVPGIRDLANIRGEQISNVGSQDMTFTILLTLAKRINALLAQTDIDGIVVTHGTDTMEESAYFLNLVVKSDKPVVLVGSMRPSTAVSADGPLNLYNAVGVAVDPQSAGRGVLVVMNDWIHAAHSLTKTSTTAIQTFMSPLRGLVGVANYSKNDYFNNPVWKHTLASEFDVLYGYLDMPADLIDSSVRNGAKGIVIAGVGNGNMNKSSLEAAAKASKQGIVVVRSTRVATGAVGRNVEVNDDAMNFIASDELNPQKARILLMLALLKPRTTSELQRLFATY
jgi:L-asparaginase